MATGSDAPALRAFRAKTEMETIAASCRGWLFTQPSNSSRGFARAVCTTPVSREERSIGIWSATIDTVDGSTWQRRVCLRMLESTNDWCWCVCVCVCLCVCVCVHIYSFVRTCVAREPRVRQEEEGGCVHTCREKSQSLHRASQKAHGTHSAVRTSRGP